jgi:hypothetical protein
MKRWITAALCAAGVLSPNLAHYACAQQTVNPEFYASAGLSLATSPKEFRDYWPAGISFGCGIGFPLASHLGLVGFFDYSRFSLSDDKWLRDVGLSGYGITVAGGDASMMTFSGNLKVLAAPPDSPTAPYFSGGIGFFHVSTTDATLYGPGGYLTLEGTSDSAFAVLFGAGIDFALVDYVDLFVDGRYTVAFTETEATQLFPIRLGVKLRT